VQLEATGSWGSNVTLSWIRRTRVGGELIDGTGEVPLAEDSEQYDLEIRFGNAVVRVVNGLTSPTYVYTPADQATDFPGFVAQGLTNPGFETGDLSGWTVESGGTWTVDNAHESLSGGHTGSWFVRSTGDGVLAQTVDVSAIARQIDLGGAQARARCWLAETASDTDQARIRLQFLDGDNALLGAVDPAFTNPTGTTFVQIEALGAIPAGTRRIKVRLDIDQVSGATPNVAIDDVTLEIDPGDLRYLNLSVWQVSAQAGRGLAGQATVEIVP
jgi:hypothetical protein